MSFLGKKKREEESTTKAAVEQKPTEAVAAPADDALECRYPHLGNPRERCGCSTCEEWRAKFYTPPPRVADKVLG